MTHVMSQKLCHHSVFVGLLSFGMGCHKSMVANGDTSTLFSAPGFFSSVCEHVSWIETTVQQNEGMCVYYTVMRIILIVMTAAY